MVSYKKLKRFAEQRILKELKSIQEQLVLEETAVDEDKKEDSFDFYKKKMRGFI